MCQQARSKQDKYLRYTVKHIVPLTGRTCKMVTPSVSRICFKKKGIKVYFQYLSHFQTFLCQSLTCSSNSVLFKIVLLDSTSATSFLFTLRNTTGIAIVWVNGFPPHKSLKFKRYFPLQPAIPLFLHLLPNHHYYRFPSDALVCLANEAFLTSRTTQAG